MFTDIVRSTQLIEAIGDEAWADLVQWPDQTLRALSPPTAGRKSIMPATASSWLLRQPAPRSSAALPFSEHSSITAGGRASLPMSASGSARISALAEAGEILASRDTVDSAPPGITLSAPRLVTLKGISEPLEVVTLGWR
jgi:hypothetical protein